MTGSKEEIDSLFDKIQIRNCCLMMQQFFFCEMLWIG